MVAFADRVQDSFKDGTDFCKQEWNAFVDAFQDQLHARGLAAAPPATKVCARAVPPLPLHSGPFRHVSTTTCSSGSIEVRHHEPS